MKLSIAALLSVCLSSGCSSWVTTTTHGLNATKAAVSAAHAISAFAFHNQALKQADGCNAQKVKAADCGALQTIWAARTRFNAGLKKTLAALGVAAIALKAAAFDAKDATLRRRALSFVALVAQEWTVLQLLGQELGVLK